MLAVPTGQQPPVVVPTGRTIGTPPVERKRYQEQADELYGTVLAKIRKQVPEGDQDRVGRRAWESYTRLKRAVDRDVVDRREVTSLTDVLQGTAHDIDRLYPVPGPRRVVRLNLSDADVPARRGSEDVSHMPGATVEDINAWLAERYRKEGDQ